MGISSIVPVLWSPLLSMTSRDAWVMPRAFAMSFRWLEGLTVNVVSSVENNRFTHWPVALILMLR